MRRSMVREGVCVAGVLIWMASVAVSVAFGLVLPPLQGVTISAAVDHSGGVFSYSYRVTNPTSNVGQIRSVDVEVTRGPAEMELSSAGLVNGPRYLRHSSEDAFQRVPMVAVGIAGPDGWLIGLGFDYDSPPNGFAGWGTIDEPFRVRPGQSQEGFQLTSYGLPGIRSAEIQPGIDYASLPDEFSDPDKARELRDSLIFRTRTVGPKAPAKDFVPAEFLNYLISLLHESQRLGWVRVDGVHQSLLTKLINAKRRLEAGDVKTASNMLHAFLNEVRATSCPEFSCPGNKPLTSEAYALLFFNGEFLLKQLP